ncbi:MAG: 3-dehydroquinate synthase [Candidatus Zixiibacteriota bacterium]|nr:MAG: 3-dehydroquinate synthase [candidate division Zixibacteria bacterium]
MRKVIVRLAERSYPVIVGIGDWKHELSRLVSHVTKPHGKLFVLCDAQLYALYGSDIISTVEKANVSVSELVLPVGERAKTLTQLRHVYGYLLDSQISRNDFILACGGGVTSDLVGLAAATTLRGVRWGILSSTLLGMVDAAIGGKTGINHKQGKNLLGTIWQPSFVICDSSFLLTLPKRQLIAGLGEVVKYAGLATHDMISALNRYLKSEDMYDQKQLTQLIYLSAQYKAGIVSKDERESSLRMVLNLGHTFGHAIERSLGYGRLLHGEAVLLGLLAAVELSGRLKKARIRRLSEYRDVICRLIELIPHHSINIEETLTAMSHDKKRLGNNLRFVLLDSLGRPVIVDNVKKNDIRMALKAALAEY